MGWWSEQQAKAKARNEKIETKWAADKQQRNARFESPGHEYLDAHRTEVIAEWGAVFVLPDRIIVAPRKRSDKKWSDPGTTNDGLLQPAMEPIAGVEAGVTMDGGIGARGTLTRSVVVGGWQKTIDNRETALVIDGPAFQWVLPLADPNMLGGARAFAAQVTSAGRRAQASGT